MRCFVVRRRLSPYIDGELGPRAAEKLKSHLAGCPRCSAEHGRLSAVRCWFAAAQRFSAPPGFPAAVMAKALTRPARAFRPAPLLAQFVTAVVVVLAIAAGSISGGVLTGSLVPHRSSEGGTVMTSLSLDAFEAYPPGSLGHGYILVTGDRR
ncbi:MAG: anti-sigma factor [Candidatus Deferrimicrobiaceae bacterium]